MGLLDFLTQERKQGDGSNNPPVKQSDLIERERAISEKERFLEKRFAKSREYRLRLQDYSQQLGLRSADLDQKAEALEKRRLEIAREEKESVSRIEEAKRDLENYRSALLNTEYRIMDYVKRVEKRELSLLDELQAGVEQAQAYQASHASDGFEFEKYVAELMEKNGFQNVTVTQKSNDFGADILAEKDGVKYVVQCKYYSSPVGIEAVQQIYAAKVYYRAHVSVVATNNIFTNAAKILAEESGVLLWDCKKVSELASEK